MYGYQPPEQQEPEGSWREILVMTKVAFQVLAGPMLVIFAALALLIFTFWALASQPILAVIPLAIGGAVIWWLVHRDKREQRTLEEEILGPGRRP